jgi:hypothetical protein
MNRGTKHSPLPMNHTLEPPLTPALSPYEGERVNLSLILEHVNDLDIRGLRIHGFNARKSVREISPWLFRIIIPPSSNFGAAEKGSG